MSLWQIAAGFATDTLYLPESCCVSRFTISIREKSLYAYARRDNQMCQNVYVEA